MASEWRTIALGEIVEFLSGGTPSKTDSGYWGGTVPWISAKDLKSFFLNDAQDHLTETGSKEATRLVGPDTVLLLVRGMTLLNDIPICLTKCEAAFNQDIKAVLPKKSVLPSYLPYLLLGHKAQLLDMVDLAGHGTGKLNTDELKLLSVRLPTESEQETVANVLCSLDDKLELNRRMNETLEEMARALFKSWFVDFDPVRAKAEGRPTGLPKPIADLFPDTFEDCELGEIPQGWNFSPLPQIIDVNPARPLRKGGIAPYLDMANMPTHEHVPDVVIERAFGSGMRFRNGDTLVARITPCLENGKTAYVDFLEDGQIGWGSTEYIVLRPKPPLPCEFAYCLARSPEFREFAIQSMTGSSGRQRVPAEALAHFYCAQPPAAVAKAFGATVAPLFARATAASRESKTLKGLRDTLLPKLISGAVRIDTAAQEIGIR